MCIRDSSHGVAEYILRYEPLAAYLTARGFAVVGHDHLGHGASVAEGVPRLYFGPPGSWDLVVEDLYTCRRHCARRFPGVPLFLLGHSMGSFLVRTYLIRHPGTVDGAILMGTGHMRPGFLAVGKAFAAHEIRRLGAERPSSAVARLSFGAYNRTFAPNRTAFDWISANAANVDAYVADPLCGGNPTMGLFREMLRGLCGEEGFTLALDGADFLLTVRLALTARQMLSDTAALLDRVVPVNLTVDLSLRYNQHQTLLGRTHAALAAYTHDQLRNEVLANGG